jgi:hypothetical protein
LLTDRFCITESKFVNIWSINNVSNFINVSNNLLSINIENGNRRYLVLKSINNVKVNFDYFGSLNNQFDEIFYQYLLSYFKNEVELAHFNPWIIHEIQKYLKEKQVKYQS